jgi:hypothetical protein
MFPFIVLVVSTCIYARNYLLLTRHHRIHLKSQTTHPPLNLSESSQWDQSTGHICGTNLTETPRSDQSMAQKCGQSNGLPSCKSSMSKPAVYSLKKTQKMTVLYAYSRHLLYNPSFSLFSTRFFLERIPE